MKKALYVFVALMMMASLLVTTASAAPAALTQTPELGQLKVCKVAGSGVAEGTLFAFRVNGSNYNVPAGPADRNGYCILAGQYPVNTQVTIEEVIPSGYYVSRIEVKPDRTVSRNTSQGIITVQIVSGVIEVIFTNKVAGSPTPTSVTSTPRPTNTATSTPSCSPNCTATPTPIPMGRMQICKEAEGSGVSGSFTFRFETRSRSVPVGACAGLTAVNAGTLTITEAAQTGYTVADIYTIPADRLISKDLNAGAAAVRIVEGTAASQTIVIFRNRAVSITPTFTSTSTFTSTPTATPTGSQTATTTATVTGTATGSITPTATHSPTSTLTSTPTGSITPTGSVTPTFTPTLTPTSTGTITACPSVSVVADFSRVSVGSPIEGFGVVAPYLNIDAKGTAIMIQPGQDPFQYRATGTGTPIVNGGIDPTGGFGDSRTQQRGQPHRYTFTFAPGISVNDFSLRMLDFGDLNPTLATNHMVTMKAYNSAKQVVTEQILSYTTDPERLPDNSPQYGNLQLSGDATGATPGQPGNWNWHVTGTGIVKIVLEFGEGHDPNVGFDSLRFTTEDCPICRPFTVTETADFSQVPLGDPIEGFGDVALYMKINAKGEALMIRPGEDPFQYRASGTGTPIVNGGIDPTGGFGDSITQRAGQPHLYTFTFAPGISVNDFSLRMLDFGDLNPTLATNHTVTMRAYNAANQVVTEQILNYTTTPLRLPPEMQMSGDATGAALGEPGNYPWHVTGTGIVKVVLEFGEGHDPNVGFDGLSYSAEVFCP